MPWLNKVPYEPRHVCNLPTTLAAGIGSTWKCDHCGIIYTITQEYVGERRRWQQYTNDAIGWGIFDDKSIQTSIPKPPPYLMD